MQDLSNGTVTDEPAKIHRSIAGGSEELHGRHRTKDGFRRRGIRRRGRWQGQQNSRSEIIINMDGVDRIPFIPFDVCMYQTISGSLLGSDISLECVGRPGADAAALVIHGMHIRRRLFPAVRSTEVLLSKHACRAGVRIGIIHSCY